ncbi:MAG: hypothetical protein AB7N76_08020 [Planctomycetota bacterium]
MTSIRRLGSLLGLVAALMLGGCCSEPPPPEPQPQPVAKTEKQVDPIYDKDPDMRGTSAEGQVAVRSDKDPRKRVLFFNNFGRKHTDLIVDELKKDPDFSEFLPGGGPPNRIAIECKYAGDNLRVSVSKAIDKVGIRHHFTEADLAKHIEIHRTKD